jgi:hypothetical protein
VSPLSFVSVTSLSSHLSPIYLSEKVQDIKLALRIIPLVIATITPP